VGADPTWPNRAGYSIPCDVTLGSGAGGRHGGNSLVARGRGAAPVRCERAAVWVVRFVVVFFSLSVPLLLLFPLFAALLNCPYPDPPVSASFFPFSSACRWGEGRLRGASVAGGSRNQDSFSPTSTPKSFSFSKYHSSCRLFYCVLSYSESVNISNQMKEASFHLLKNYFLFCY